MNVRQKRMLMGAVCGMLIGMCIDRIVYGKGGRKRCTN